MEKINTLIAHLSQKNHFSVYLSLFRIFLGFHIIKKVYYLWGSQSILLSADSILFTPTSSFIQYFGIDPILILNNSSIFLLALVFTSLLVMFGIGRRISLIVLYILIRILQDLVYPVLNGGDNLMSFVMLYLIFTDCFQHFTLKANLKESSKTRKMISNLAVYSICIHLGYVYFISAIHKIHSDVWFNGTALYYIMHIERFESPLSKYIFNNGFITTCATYFTVLFEMLFIFLIWNKALRPLFLVSGIMLHMGIYFFMMIYDFEIFFMSLYGFFIGNYVWIRLINRIRRFLSKPALTLNPSFEHETV